MGVLFSVSTLKLNDDADRILNRMQAIRRRESKAKALEDALESMYDFNFEPKTKKDKDNMQIAQNAIMQADEAPRGWSLAYMANVVRHAQWKMSTP